MGINSSEGRVNLIKDLENLHQTLITDTKSLSREQVPVPILDQVIGHQKTIQSQQSNPFLSSKTLEDLISKRNDAESQAAAELAALSINGIPAILPDKVSADLSTKMNNFSQQLINQLVDDIPLIVGQVLQTHMPVIQAAVQAEMVARIEQLVNILNESDDQP